MISNPLPQGICGNRDLRHVSQIANDLSERGQEMHQNLKRRCTRSPA